MKMKISFSNERERYIYRMIIKHFGACIRQSTYLNDTNNTLKYFTFCR